MYGTIIALPLIGSFCAGALGRWLGFRGAAFITTLFVTICTIFSWIAFYEVALSGSFCYIPVGAWILSEMFDVSWLFLFDPLTVVMLIVVTSVSTLVHLYSISYMWSDPHLPRFMSYLSIFTFFMLILVTAGNLVQMFLGWEGVGLASYLLINFWFTRLQANKSAIKAMLMNRVGDVGLALAIMGIFYTFQSVDFSVLLALTYWGNTSENFFTFVSLLLFVGSIGKSAQLGLHTWLPDAMEGPTPVSALIHAATMVTAGVFLIARCSALFEQSVHASFLVALVGAMTAFFAATTGAAQNDLKRVIAYSTCSQLGYMVFASGLSHYDLSVFHLMNHAFFKALLFLGAGSVIHALSDEQDLRRMGGLVQLLPFTYTMMLIGSLSLVGIPFLTGFYSKDAILEVAYAKYTVSAHFAYWLGSLSVLFTSTYSFQLLQSAFLTSTNAKRFALAKIHESDLLLSLPLVLLAFGSIFVGYLAKDMMIGLGTDFWSQSLFVQPYNVRLLEAEFATPISIKMVPLVFSFFGALIAHLLQNNKNVQTFIFSLLLFNPATDFLRSIYSFWLKRWLFDKVYNDFIVGPCISFGYYVTFKTIDKGFLEWLGPLGISYTIQKFGSTLSRFQSGYIYHYAFVMLIAFTTFISMQTESTFQLQSTLSLISFLSILFFVKTPESK
uniref:NADH-ubiquinone oxidoreductase chain 5 n=1 Tax=Mesostigma viride TaxID=41882 RepID=Q8W9Q3_MESVI|nr:NADH dehydrogenase subunit 5 [Mesostigma viride]AAL36755.1 NADH dehydrogenase subunit 5 [Mesostigma viride]